MSAYFIDFQTCVDNYEEPIIKELCIMKSDNVLNPWYFVFKAEQPWCTLTREAQYHNEYLRHNQHDIEWEEGNVDFCSNCILHSLGKIESNSIFYVLDEDKLKITNKYFPTLRVTTYSKSDFQVLPNNIKCIWRDHGDYCAYKQCLLATLDYINGI